MRPLPSDALDFRGKVVLITGAATSLSRAVAVAFARHGALLSIGNTDDAATASMLEFVERNGHEALFTPTDPSRESDVKALIARTVSRLGRLDCAFNHARFTPAVESRNAPPPLDARRLDPGPSADWYGVWLCMTCELEQMVRARKGAIVNAVTGVLAEPGFPDQVAAKQGLIGLTRAAALAYASHGVRVNALASGQAETPDEIAASALFLCSEGAAHVTGQVCLVAPPARTPPPAYQPTMHTVPGSTMVAANAASHPRFPEVTTDE